MSTPVSSTMLELVGHTEGQAALASWNECPSKQSVVMSPQFLKPEEQIAFFDNSEQPMYLQFAFALESAWIWEIAGLLDAVIRLRKYRGRLGRQGNRPWAIIEGTAYEKTKSTCSTIHGADSRGMHESESG
jgi:hypothetical protein